MLEEGEKAQFKEFLDNLGVPTKDLTDEQLSAMYSKYQVMYDDFKGERDLLDIEQGQAEGLRDRVQSGLGGVQAGNVFVADNPWEGVAAVGSEFLTNRKNKKLNEERRGVNERATAARAQHSAAMANAIRERGAQEQQAKSAQPQGTGGATPTAQGPAGAAPPAGPQQPTPQAAMPPQAPPAPRAPMAGVPNQQGPMRSPQPNQAPRPMAEQLGMEGFQAMQKNAPTNAGKAEAIRRQQEEEEQRRKLRMFQDRGGAF